MNKVIKVRDVLRATVMTAFAVFYAACLVCMLGAAVACVREIVELAL